MCKDYPIDMYQPYQDEEISLKKLTKSMSNIIIIKGREKNVRSFRNIVFLKDIKTYCEKLFFPAQYIFLNYNFTRTVSFFTRELDIKLGIFPLMN